MKPGARPSIDLARLPARASPIITTEDRICSRRSAIPTRARRARPSLYDQVEACRAYADSKGYHIVGEFNDIDSPTHPNEGAGAAAVLEKLGENPSTVVLIYQPDADVLERLQGRAGALESVPALASRAARMP